MAVGKAASRRASGWCHEGKLDLVVAFPGGRGTANVIKRARACEASSILKS
jgi:hypothetical protein